MRTEARSEREAVVSTTSANRRRSRTPMRSISRRRNRLSASNLSSAASTVSRFCRTVRSIPTLVGAADSTFCWASQYSSSGSRTRVEASELLFPNIVQTRFTMRGAPRRYSNTADRLTPLASHRSHWFKARSGSAVFPMASSNEGRMPAN